MEELERAKVELARMLERKPLKPLPLLPVKANQRPDPSHIEKRKIYQAWQEEFAAAEQLVVRLEDKVKKEEARRKSKMEEKRIAEERKRAEEVQAMERQKLHAQKEEERKKKEEMALLKAKKREENKKKKEERSVLMEQDRVKRGLSKEELEEEHRLRKEALSIQRQSKKHAEQEQFENEIEAIRSSSQSEEMIRQQMRQLLLAKEQKKGTTNPITFAMGCMGVAPFLTKWIDIIIEKDQKQIDFITRTIIRGRKEMIEECVKWGETEDVAYQESLLEKYLGIVNELQKNIEYLVHYKATK